MAVTAFISRLREASDPLADQMGFQHAGSQVPLGDSSAAPPNTVRLLEPTRAAEYLNSIYPPLRRHYDWFRRTQKGQIKQWSRQAHSSSEGYRWRGRSEQHVLTSGLDDYPRAKAHIGELHVDLISWVGFFSRTMREIAEFVGKTADAEEFRSIEQAVLKNIDGMRNLQVSLLR
jgi:mannosyl-oligosaccharide glucosidase